MITEATIQKVSEALSSIEEQDLAASQIEQNQPALYNLIFGYPEDYSEFEADFQCIFGMLIWKTMIDEYPEIKKISFDDIESTLEKNSIILTQIDELADGDAMVFVEKLTENYQQSELLVFAISALVYADEEDDGSEENYVIREDMKGSLLLVLKTSLDCLNEAR